MNMKSNYEKYVSPLAAHFFVTYKIGLNYKITLR